MEVHKSALLYDFDRQNEEGDEVGEERGCQRSQNEGMEKLGQTGAAVNEWP
jgi:hypothetical protein